MPDTYAHYTFGHKVLAHLKQNNRDFIIANIDIFNVGLQGPDILFYYKPFILNSINSVGYKLHKKPATKFFKRAKTIIRKSVNIELAKSYIAGFICHYVLDSECHPIINYLSDNNEDYSHSEIETEFDRLLLIDDGYDPINYRVAEHLEVNRKTAGQIAVFYPQKRIDAKKIIKSVEGMKKYSVLIEELSQMNVIKDRESKSDKGVIEFAKGLIMQTQAIEQYFDSNIILKELYTRAIIPAADLIDQYFKDLYSDKLSKKFNKRFN